MKKVVSVVSAPFRAIGRILLKILRQIMRAPRRLRVLGTPFVKLSKLRGRPLAIAGGAILVLLIIAVITLKPGPDSDKQVRETLDRYAQATRDKDYQTLCDDLLASALVEQILRGGLPCEVALKTGLDERKNPRLQVLAVEVSGDQAAARARTTAIGEPTSVDTIRLVRQDESWRVASLQQPGSGASLPAAAP
jgi:ketosteroid isomerase-like protein